MGCNCKSGKEMKLNNMDSVDHLKMASDIYESIIVGKPREEWDEMDVKELTQTYFQLYPRQKMGVSLEQAVSSITHAHNQYKSKR